MQEEEVRAMAGERSQQQAEEEDGQPLEQRARLLRGQSSWMGSTQPRNANAAGIGAANCAGPHPILSRGMRDGPAWRLLWFMQTTRRRQLLYAMLGFTFGQLLIGAKPLAAQDDCKLVLDAMTKFFDTPTHAYITMNLSGKPQDAESIYVGGLIYTNGVPE
jgi:hypothetical protein